MTTVLKFNQSPKNGFNNLFENLLREVPTNFPDQKFNPAVNISENNEAFFIELNAPGRQKENFNINVDKKLLTISYNPAEKNSDESVKSIRREFNLNGFSRTFTIDEKIAADNISAKYENGILIVTLPKKEEVKVQAKQITIS